MQSPSLSHLSWFPKPALPGKPLLISAPLAGLSHSGLRRLWADIGGCDVFYSEMVSADAYLASSPFRFAYLDPAGQGHRTIFQIVGSDTETMCAAMTGIVDHFMEMEDTTGQRQALGFDLNMGCSAPEMVRKGAGVEWMKRPGEVADLVMRMRKIVLQGRYSLSVKMRLGEDDDFPRLDTFCRGIASAGADFITLHPRVRKDPWGRPAKQNRTPQLAAGLSIPVFANGDLGSREACKSFLDSWSAQSPDRHCQGIMTGRGAVSAPWFFNWVKKDWEDGSGSLVPIEGGSGNLQVSLGLSGPTARESPATGGHDTIDRLAIAREFHRLLEEHVPREFWLTRGKRFHAWFCLPLMFGHRVAAQVQSLGTYGEIWPLVEESLEHASDRFVSRTQAQERQ